MIVVTILAILSTQAEDHYRSSLGMATEVVAVKELQDLVAAIELYEQRLLSAGLLPNSTAQTMQSMRIAA